MPKALWFTNPDDKEAIANALKHSPAFNRLRQIIQDRLSELEAREVKPETYKDLSWSHVQAHFNGRKQELIYLINLLDPGDTE